MYIDGLKPAPKISGGDGFSAPKHWDSAMGFWVMMLRNWALWPHDVGFCPMKMFHHVGMLTLPVVSRIRLGGG